MNSKEKYQLDPNKWLSTLSNKNTNSLINQSTNQSTNKSTKKYFCRVG